MAAKWFFIFIDTDVHVKILGKSEDVKTAKERVLEKLDARVRYYVFNANVHFLKLLSTLAQGSRVTMKMDISFNDHSSIIGQKGNNIKKIMDETSTHIHFPDSNKEAKEAKEAKESKDFAMKTLKCLVTGNHSYSRL